jgi:3-oxoacyl-[acyl-carrier protein] reductase
MDAAERERGTPRVALVTGASGELGAALCRALHGSGLRVLALTRDPARIERRFAGGWQPQAQVFDLQHGDYRALAAALPPCAVLVHNAAAYAPYGRLENLDPADLDPVLAVGPRAAALLCGLFLAQHDAGAHRRIVLVGSAAASLGAHGQVAYAAAKAAYRGLVRSVALEGAPRGVTCKLLELGLVDTERTRTQLSHEARRAVLARSALGRAARPEEVAAVLQFLLSPAAELLTGAVLPFTGGLGLGVTARPQEDGTPC